ncbi:uncharacterized protein J3R85_016694 [Psidium guajava]|nr:uncharacterized protein J3R85_016694 [Psidium guajava]
MLESHGATCLSRCLKVTVVRVMKLKCCIIFNSFSTLFEGEEFMVNGTPVYPPLPAAWA